MASKDHRDRAGTAPGRGTTIVEKGNFAHASCACGWRGPARRSRKRARDDARAHLDSGCPAAGG